MKLIECPRDAMQSLPIFIPTNNKIKYLNQLLKVGFDTIDIGSFVSKRQIPQLADTAEVLNNINIDNSISKLLVIVGNNRGAVEASKFDQISYIGFPFSISETFQKKNINASVQDSLKTLEKIQNLCIQKNKKLVFCFVFDHVILENIKSSPFSILDSKSLHVDKRLGFIYLTLSEIKKKLQAFGSDLLILQGDPVEVIPKAAETVNAGCVFWSKDYEQYARKRDEKISQSLEVLNIRSSQIKSQCVFEEFEVLTNEGNPYTVFTPYKKKWLNDLTKVLKKLGQKNENIILSGDFNIIPAAEDVYNAKSFEDDALFRLEIRKKYREILNMGYVDSYRHKYPDTEGYTFWDYMRGAWQKNNGMRIDHFLLSNSLINILKNVSINKTPRGKEKPSDHTPIEIELA